MVISLCFVLVGILGLIVWWDNKAVDDDDKN